jgi:hypothetical protein
VLLIRFRLFACVVVVAMKHDKTENATAVIVIGTIKSTKCVVFLSLFVVRSERKAAVALFAGSNFKSDF